MVSAINAKEIKVTFNKELNKSSAEADGNYEVFVGATQKAATTDYVSKLQKDNKTVILQLQVGDELANGDSIKVNVKDVLDVNYNIVTEYKGSYQIFDDKMAPILIKSELNAGTLKLTFDKAIDGNPTTIKVDDVTVSGVSTSTVAGKYEVTATGLTNDQKSLGNHTVKVYGAKDFAGNTASLITGSFTVTADSEKPGVESVTVESQDTFKVKFDSAISSVSAANFEVKKGSYTFPAGQLTVNPVVGETNTYTVKVAGTTDNPLYAQGENSVALNIKVKDFKGTNDVFGTDYSAAVTLAKDVTPPTIQSASLNRVESGKLVLIFNEKVKSLDSTKISVTKDGVLETVNTGASNTLIDPTDNKKLLIDVGALTSGTYNVTLSKGAVKDLSDNDNLALTTTVVNKGNADTAIQPSTVVGTGATSNGKNVLTINYGSGVKMTDSALNLANYKLDGVPLNDASFAGTTIGFTSSAKEQVKITLAKGNVKGDAAAKLVEISKNVKTEAGEFIADSADKTKAYTVSNSQLNDDIAPVLEKSEFVKSASSDTTSNVVKLTFSKAVTSTDVQDYLVKVAGTKVAVSNIVQDSNKEVVLKLATSVNLSQSGTLEITTDKDYNTNGTIEIQDTLANTNKSITKQVSLSTSIVDAGLFATANPGAPVAPTVTLAEGSAAGTTAHGLATDGTIEYSKNSGAWTSLSTADIAVNNGDTLSFRVKALGLTPAGEVTTKTVALTDIKPATLSGVGSAAATTTSGSTKITGLTSGVTYEYIMDTTNGAAVDWSTATSFTASSTDEDEIAAGANTKLHIRVKATATQPASIPQLDITIVPKA